MSLYTEIAPEVMERVWAEDLKASHGRVLVTAVPNSVTKYELNGDISYFQYGSITLRVAPDRISGWARHSAKGEVKLNW